MPTYSFALRQRVLADCDAGLKTKQVAQRYGVSRTWIRALKQRRRETGDFAARIPRCGGKPKFERTRLAELVAAQPDATLAELRERLGVQCALSAICVALARARCRPGRIECDEVRAFVHCKEKLVRGAKAPPGRLTN